MSTLFPKRYNTISHGAGSLDQSTGRWEPGVDSESFFLGSVQPLTGKEVESLTIGRANTGKVKVYSDRVLKVSTDGGKDAGTIIIFKNQKWEVIGESDYDSDLIPHYKYIAELREETV